MRGGSSAQRRESASASRCTSRTSDQNRARAPRRSGAGRRPLRAPPEAPEHLTQTVPHVSSPSRAIFGKGAWLDRALGASIFHVQSIKESSMQMRMSLDASNDLADAPGGEGELLKSLGVPLLPWPCLSRALTGLAG